MSDDITTNVNTTNNHNTNTTSSSTTSLFPHLDHLIRYEIPLGYPILYGVCLQKQHVQPTHYHPPHTLYIKNNYSPYLYRYNIFIPT
jgi:hypothetical protein